MITWHKPLNHLHYSDSWQSIKTFIDLFWIGKLTCSGPDHLQVNFKKVNLGGGREEGGPKVHSTSMVISRSHLFIIIFSGNVKKKSKFNDIIQIKVDHPPSYPTFWQIIFWQVLIRWSTHPTYWIFDKNIAKKTAFYYFWTIVTNFFLLVIIKNLNLSKISTSIQNFHSKERTNRGKYG